MNIRISSFLITVIASINIQAASEHVIWGNAKLLRGQYNLINKDKRKEIIQSFMTNKQSDYQLKAIESDGVTNTDDVRYQLYYKHIPIWSHQLITHKGQKKNDFVTGVEVSGIEYDLATLKETLTAETIEERLLASIKDKILFKNIEKIIYLDDAHKAHLAYQLVLYTSDVNTHHPASPNYIVDAHSGELLKQWDDLTRERVGQGLGGNVFILPYREGVYQFGSSQPDLPSLGTFEVRIDKGTCYLETPEVKVVNVAKTNMDKSSFPLLSLFEFFNPPPTFSYPCSKKSKFINKNDGDTAPAHYSFSSVNDTMYFASVTLDMYKHFYGLAHPIGTDLPLRAYTHIKDFDNAYAVPNIKLKGVTVIHQQIIIGDGETKLTAPAQGTIAHELSHNVTRLHSNLVYSKQSGGINEAFSDMASIAMFDYLSIDYPWYWDGENWSVGAEATIGAEPIRYMDEPAKDGVSIDHARSYNDTLDVHHSSGVFNKAFYLLSHQKGWSLRMAFQVMLDANIKYWTPDTHFEAAACGVIQAAKDRKYRKQDVIAAFDAVGVVCPLKL